MLLGPSEATCYLCSGARPIPSCSQPVLRSLPCAPELRRVSRVGMCPGVLSSDQIHCVSATCPRSSVPTA